jgi:hypothetical protein
MTSNREHSDQGKPPLRPGEESAQKWNGGKITKCKNICTSTEALPTKSETQAAQGNNTHLNTTARSSFLTPPTHYTHCFLLITYCSPLSPDPYLDLPSFALHPLFAEAQLLKRALPWRDQLFLTDPLLYTDTLLSTDYVFFPDPLLWQIARSLQSARYRSPDCLGVSYIPQLYHSYTTARFSFYTSHTLHTLLSVDHSLLTPFTGPISRSPVFCTPSIPCRGTAFDKSPTLERSHVSHRPLALHRDLAPYRLPVLVRAAALAVRSLFIGPLLFTDRPIQIRITRLPRIILQPAAQRR